MVRGDMMLNAMQAVSGRFDSVKPIAREEEVTATTRSVYIVRKSSVTITVLSRQGNTTVTTGMTVTTVAQQGEMFLTGDKAGTKIVKEQGPGPTMDKRGTTGRPAAMSSTGGKTAMKTLLTTREKYSREVKDPIPGKMFLTGASVAMKTTPPTLRGKYSHGLKDRIQEEMYLTGDKAATKATGLITPGR